MEYTIMSQLDQHTPSQLCPCTLDGLAHSTGHPACLPPPHMLLRLALNYFSAVSSSSSLSRSWVCCHR